MLCWSTLSLRLMSPVAFLFSINLLFLLLLKRFCPDPWGITLKTILLPPFLFRISLSPLSGRRLNPWDRISEVYFSLTLERLQGRQYLDLPPPPSPPYLSGPTSFPMSHEHQLTASLPDKFSRRRPPSSACRTSSPAAPPLNSPASGIKTDDNRQNG